MRRIVSLVCATALTVAGAVLCFFEFTRAHEYSPINYKMTLGARYFSLASVWLVAMVRLQAME